MKKILSLVLAIAVCAVYYYYAPDGEEIDYEVGRYELPVDNSDAPAIYIEHTAYALSFNPEELIPNWVAWEINPERLIERESRSNDFMPDPDLSPELAITTDEYKGSGWDRGHMCPAGDNRWHWQAMNECFYMSNICPQNHNLNSGDWKELEEECRKWAKSEPVYVVCGPILYAKPRYGYIGKTRDVRIPEAFFKVVLTGVDSGNPRAIGFVFKNEKGNHKRDKYVNTVDEVERITGLDFFSLLADDVENTIEAEYDLGAWR